MISPYESSSGPPLDSAILGDLCHELGGKQSEGFREAVATYIEDAVLRLKNLQVSANLKLTSAIQHEAHALKGTSGYFGARLLQAHCLQIEELSKSNRFDEIENKVAELEIEFGRVRAALETDWGYGSA